MGFGRNPETELGPPDFCCKYLYTLSHLDNPTLIFKFIFLLRSNVGKVHTREVMLRSIKRNTESAPKVYFIR